MSTASNAPSSKLAVTFRETSMKRSKHALSACAGVWLSLTGSAWASDCVVPPLNFNSHVAELISEVTVKAGKGCGFGLNGISGAIREVVITQRPRVGAAGVRGTVAYYVAKPGYQGPDEFAYAYIGTDQYGGPMRVVVKRRVTVVP
jgi:hypothetical protein